MSRSALMASGAALHVGGRISAVTCRQSPQNCGAGETGGFRGRGRYTMGPNEGACLPLCWAQGLVGLGGAPRLRRVSFL